ncbi:MAG TPA: MazG family protein [Nocardioides sp.]|uniref:MazG family protein n=1 Tax=uncultured Nocardioides sp. TaxID=198441 RepID=UPI00262E2B4A|nr:MazG family protein [uncultured Nocardioides sp.]HRD62873.1 MazG family protein [Nocardioides sp.]HRI95965.1 MazG family protein [Nocardioides sp.]HRK47365.1 MazG family protein [Nocardioides sp.]
MTAPASGEPLLEFLAVMRQLRAECPWKREQTHRSLARYLLEETHETLEAIDTGDLEHLREELGDLLLQIYFHAVIAEEEGAFTIDDVARGITEKMYRRNPHVFAPDSNDQPQDAAAVDKLWQAIKERDKPRSSPTDGLPDTLPALLYAAKAIERGVTAPENAADLGERLLTLVAEAVAAGEDPEQALRDAVRRR